MTTARPGIPGLLWLWPLLLSAVSLTASDWPQFLGPTRDGCYTGNELATHWPKEGPRLQWQKKVGQGFSAPVVQDGRLLLFHRLDDKETVECWTATNGQPVWHYDYPTTYRDDFGFDEGPRATPAIAAGKVYTFGAEGRLHCLDLATGKPLWTVDTQHDFQAPKGFFGMACSPLVVGNKVLVNIGGPNGAGIVAFDKDTGHLLWHATTDEASYSSPVSTTINAQPCVLFFARSGLIALDPENGQPQFDFPWRSRSHASVNAATPLVIGDMIFLSASYGTGAVLLQAQGKALTKLWSSDEVLSSHYATSVQRSGFLYGFHGRQEYGPSLRCVELRTGKVQWSQEGFGAGTLLAAEVGLLVMKEDGQLLLLAASPERYQELGRAQILPTGVRAYPALARGLFFARGKDTLVCLDLRPHL